jgi:hypothetical protein
MRNALSAVPGDINGEVEECARHVFLELTRGTPRPEPWYRWYLCERHGGAPLIDPCIPPQQVAYWDGDDIMIAAGAPLPAIIDALPEELAHRLSGTDAARFEPLNYLLRQAPALARSEFQERVGQRVAQLFAVPFGRDGTLCPSPAERSEGIQGEGDLGGEGTCELFC